MTTLHADIVGEGSPLVLLHGFTESVESWAPLRASLGGRYRTIALDLPGHGRTPASPDPGRYALPRVADDIARELDVLGLDRVALMGYSMGGRTALHVAMRHPSRLSALVLESASPGIADEEECAARIRADVALADDIERGGIEAFVDRWEALPLWESQRAMTAEWRAQLRSRRLRNDPAGLANSLRGAGAGVEPSLAPKLGALRVPTLLVAGALDTKYVAIATRMAQAMPAARLAVVEGAGHAVHLERPDALGQVVSRFLDDPSRL